MSGDDRRRRGSRVPPLALLIGAAVAQRVLARDDRPAGHVGRKAGAATGVISAGVLVSSVATFRARRTTVDPRAGARPASLVTDGANSFTRNPMYVGMAGMLLAHGLWWGRTATLVPAAMFVAWIDRTQIPGEEMDLREAFPGSYDAYAARVPRWLGPRRSGPDRLPSGLGSDPR